MKLIVSALISLVALAFILSGLTMHAQRDRNDKPSTAHDGMQVQPAPAAETSVPTIPDATKVKLLQAQHDLDQLNLQYVQLQAQMSQLSRKFHPSN